MLIFNDQQIVSLENYDGENKTSFFTFGNYKYAFVNNKLFVDEQKDTAYILGKYSDDAEFMVFTGKLNFEKGKYYVYNSVSNFSSNFKGFYENFSSFLKKFLFFL